MDPIVSKQHIAALILKEKTIGLTQPEQQELASWRQTDARNEEIYTRLHEKDFSSELSRYRQISISKGLEQYRKRYVIGKSKPRVTRWYWVAAAVVLMIGITSLLFRSGDTDIPQTGIVPGNAKATLVLNNGDIINLSGKENNEIVTMEELSIRNNGSELQYSLSENRRNSYTNNYNELIVPKGGEFTLTLSDGTKVWLNSQSKLKYPVVFSTGSREVYLEVLGTSFNVRSYTDEDRVETVLEEGSVRMNRGKDSVILRPGYKAVYQPNENIQVTSVNTELYTAWRHGQYIFTNESVENILKQLSRWYNIEVFYCNEAAKSVIFSGDVRKYDNITTLLEAMEIAGGVHFKINGNTLIVSYEK